MVLRVALMLLLLGARPSSAQQDPPRWDCCFHLLSVAANLAWTEALTRASIPRTRLEPADNTILENLERAARHTESAMKVCSRFNPVEWHQLPFAIRLQADSLRERPTPERRRAITIALGDMYRWYKPLNNIRLDTSMGSADNCEGLYYRLAWHIGAVVQNLRIVREGRARGLPVTTFVDQARMHARAGLPLVNSYNAKPDCARTNLAAYWSSLSRVASDPSPEAALDDADAAWRTFQGDVVKGCPVPAGVFDGASQPGFCILRKPAVPVREDGVVCYEFRLADASVPGAARMITIGPSTTGGARCFATAYAWRSNWQVEPSRLGGPFRTWQEADRALSALSRYQRDAYRCFETGPTPPPLPTPRPVVPPGGGGRPPNPTPPPPQVRTVTVSGGLDPVKLAEKIAAKRAAGADVTFRSGSLTLTVGPNGACAITPTLRFEYASYTRGRLGVRYANDYQFSGARSSSDGRSCSGDCRVTHVLTGADGRPLRPQTVHGNWNASRQANGSWILSLPNGRGGTVSDMPYLLR